MKTVVFCFRALLLALLFASTFALGEDRTVALSNGIYVSEYVLECTATGLSYDASYAACAAKPGGWAMASFPSIKAARAFGEYALGVQPFDQSTNWVGADDIAVEGEWRWQSGRLKGIMFSLVSTCFPHWFNPVGSNMQTFHDCAWYPGEPNSAGGNEDCAELYINRLIPEAQRHTMNDNSCGKQFTCYACERSPCIVGVDCQQQSTRQMTGDFFPNCVCHCFEGYGGQKCERTLIDHGSYESQYDLKCVNNSLPFAEAEKLCTLRGEGWTVATFPTRVSLNAFWTTLYPYLHTYVGMSDLAEGGVWRWTHGRLKGRQIPLKSGTNCESPLAYVPVDSTLTYFSDCNTWGVGQPDNYLVERHGEINFQGDLNNIKDATIAQCVACERSPCKIGTDCSVAGTLSMTGVWFPDCACVCKPGYRGSKCEILDVDNGLYPSHYKVECASPDDKMSFAEAASRSHSTAPQNPDNPDDFAGWTLATVPTAAAASKISTQLQSPFEQAWVAASATHYLVNQSSSAPVSALSVWRWSDGRLRGLNFTQTAFSFSSSASSGNVTRCVSPAFRPLAGDASWRFSNCSWGTAEPKEDVVDAAPLPSTISSAAFFASPSTTNANLASTPLAAGLQLRCYVKERFPCTQGIDCVAAGTERVVGDFYPNCACVCKPSYEGDRCEVVSVTVTNPSTAAAAYRSDFTLKCGFGQDAGRGGGMGLLDAARQCGSLSVPGSKASSGHWFLSSLPTSRVAANIGTFLAEPSNGDATLAWTAAREVQLLGAPPSWRWAAGRVLFSEFSRGASCTPIYFNLFGQSAAVALADCPPWSASPLPPRSSASCSFFLRNASGAAGLSSAPCDATAITQRDIECYLCERSACQIGVDCFAPNTLSVSGFHPNCTCQCQSGAFGPKCEWPLVINHGPFSSEYRVVALPPSEDHVRSATLPVSDALDYHQAGVGCASLGPEWHLATFPNTATVNSVSLLQARLAGVLGVAWVGARYARGGGWSYDGGRLDRRVFFSANLSSSAAPGQGLCHTVPLLRPNAKASLLSGCPWAPGHPVLRLNASGQEADDKQGLCAMLAPVPTAAGAGISGEMRLLEANCSDASIASRYVCERSPCSLGADCYAPNTASVSGHYPDCRCTCKPGHGGARCEGYAASSTETTTATFEVTSSLSRSASQRSPSTTATPQYSDTFSSSLQPPPTASSSLSPSLPHNTSTTTVTMSRTANMTLTYNKDEDPDARSRTVNGTATRSLDTSSSDSLVATLSAENTQTGTLTPSLLVSDSGNRTKEPTASGEISASASPSVSRNLTAAMSASLSNEATATPPVDRTRSATHTAALTKTYQIVFPPEIIGNAPEEDGGGVGSELVFAAAPELTDEPIAMASCPRLERILSSSGLLAPIQNIAWTYEDVQLVNFVFLLVAGALGVATAVLFGVYDGAQHVRRERQKKTFSPTNNGSKKKSTLWTALDESAASIKFPATTLQCLAYLSHGSAVAAGLGLAANTQSVASSTGNSFALIALCAAPVVCSATVFVLCRKPQIATAELDDKNQDDTKLVYSPASGAVTGTSKAKRPILGFHLLCAEVRPQNRARQLGPILGDLGFHNILTPALPCLLPLVLLFVSAVARAAVNDCSLVPIIIGVVYLVYAVAVALVRPFLALSHNGIEAFSALTVGISLVALGAALKSSEKEIFEVPASVVAPILVAVAVSNSRYPFILARVLDVVFPAVRVTVYEPKEKTSVTDSNAPNITFFERVVDSAPNDVEGWAEAEGGEALLLYGGEDGDGAGEEGYEGAKYADETLPAEAEEDVWGDSYAGTAPVSRFDFDVDDL